MNVLLAFGLILIVLFLCLVGFLILREKREQKERVLKDQIFKLSKLAQLSYWPVYEPTPMLCADQNGKIIFANRASESILSAWDTAKGSLLPSMVQAPLQSVLEQKKWDSVLLKINEIIYQISLVPDKAFKTVALYIQDVTRQKKMEQTLVKNEIYDSVTSLPNRTLFQDYLKLELVYQKAGTKVFVMVVKLIDYVNINTHYDAEFCGKILNLTRLQLKRFLSDDAILAKLGEKEFGIMEPVYAQLEQVFDLAKKIIAYFDRPIVIDTKEVISRIAIGIACYPEDGSYPKTLLAHAKIAQQKALLQPNRFASYIVEQDSAAQTQKGLLVDLYQAIEKNEFVVVYQPQVILSTEYRIGAEALIRWKHPTLGFISPLSFVPLAESSGLIIPLGQWIIEQVCKDIAQWKAKDPAHWEHCKIAINLSAVQFQNEALLPNIQATLLKSNLFTNNIEFELTESILSHDMEEVITKMNLLQESGFSLAMDDFGTGYSSLSYLKKLPLNKLKIDKAFIDDIEYHEPSLSLVKTIIELGHNLGLKALAEGVETQGQIDILKRLNCDIIQGYYYSKPISAAEFGVWVSG